jgi:hypothetical protein
MQNTLRLSPQGVIFFFRLSAGQKRRLPKESFKINGLAVW